MSALLKLISNKKNEEILLKRTPSFKKNYKNGDVIDVPTTADGDADTEISEGLDKSHMYVYQTYQWKLKNQQAKQNALDKQKQKSKGNDEKHVDNKIYGSVNYNP